MLRKEGGDSGRPRVFIRSSNVWIQFEQVVSIDYYTRISYPLREIEQCADRVVGKWEINTKA